MSNQAHGVPSTEADEVTPTGIEAETLSDADRELFLRGRGLLPGIPKEKATAIRNQWPDEDILMAMELGGF